MQFLGFTIPKTLVIGNCGWGRICDDNDYSRGEDRDVEIMILDDFTIYEYAIRQL